MMITTSTGKKIRMCTASSERGAALITMLLVSTLLLTAGSALILTTAKSTVNAVNATAEAQAYYGAEAGLQGALNAIRRNRPASPALAVGQKMSFRNAVTIANSNDVAGGDTSTEARLSRWLPYSDGTGTPSDAPTARVNVGNGVRYTVQITDPANPNRAALNALLIANPNYVPNRLLITSTGFGPRGAEKRMQAMVDRVAFQFTPNSTVFMRGATGTSPDPMTLTTGSSAAKTYSGVDNASLSAQLPVFGTTSAADESIARDSSNKGTFSNPRAEVVTNSSLASNMPWLVPEANGDALKARTFLDSQETLALALEEGGDAAHHPAGFAGYTNGFTFVNGNCSLYGGSGLLIVTGELTMSGGTSFDGLILVLGEGEVNRSGGGGGDIYGSMVVAKFDRTWPAIEDGDPHPFLAPWFDTSGGGSSKLQYDSAALSGALSNVGNIVVGVSEF